MYFFHLSNKFYKTKTQKYVEHLPYAFSKSTNKNDPIPYKEMVIQIFGFADSPSKRNNADGMKKPQGNGPCGII